MAAAAFHVQLLVSFVLAAEGVTVLTNMTKLHTCCICDHKDHTFPQKIDYFRHHYCSRKADFGLRACDTFEIDVNKPCAEAMEMTVPPSERCELERDLYPSLCKITYKPHDRVPMTEIKKRLRIGVHQPVRDIAASVVESDAGRVVDEITTRVDGKVIYSSEVQADAQADAQTIEAGCLTEHQAGDAQHQLDFWEKLCAPGKRHCKAGGGEKGGAIPGMCGGSMIEDYRTRASAERAASTRARTKETRNEIAKEQKEKEEKEWREQHEAWKKNNGFI